MQLLLLANCRYNGFDKVWMEAQAGFGQKCFGPHLLSVVQCAERLGHAMQKLITRCRQRICRGMRFGAGPTHEAGIAMACTSTI